jgi:hypothetical protein
MSGIYQSLWVFGQNESDGIICINHQVNPLLIRLRHLLGSKFFAAPKISGGFATDEKSMMKLESEN